MTSAAAPLTIDSLAEQLAALRTELDALRQENARLSALVGGQRWQAVPAVGPASQERTSRRQVLGTGMKLAAGAVAAGVMLGQQTEPALADPSHTSTYFEETNDSWAIWAHATTLEAWTIYADGASNVNAVILGTTSGIAPGVMGESFGNGVQGRSQGQAMSGVFGNNTSNGFGVAGETESAASGNVAAIRSGVIGRNAGTGPGVFGNSVNANGDGVQGRGKVGVRGVSINGNGVLGQGGTGYGGQFQGTRAQLRLTPTSRTGKPDSGLHQVGEVYLDQAGSMFICTVAGTPGTWRRVNTTVT